MVNIKCVLSKIALFSTVFAHNRSPWGFYVMTHTGPVELHLLLDAKQDCDQNVKLQDGLSLSMHTWLGLSLGTFMSHD